MSRRVLVIPARGGSKRIPRKNIRSFLGQPMIGYPLAAARDSGLFHRIIVSTDDPEIAAVARQYGAETPFLRPAALSDEHTGTLPVVAHALDELARAGDTADLACCLYATTPLVRAEDLRASMKLLEASDIRYVLAVARFHFPVQRSLKVDASGRAAALFPEHIGRRSQDLEPAYHDAGQFLWGRVPAFLASEPVFTSPTAAYELPPERVQDIDTPEDWTRAELLYRMLQQ